MDIHRRLFIVLIAVVLTMTGRSFGAAGESSDSRCFVIEVYGSSGDALTDSLLNSMDDFLAERKGITLVFRDIRNDVQKQRLRTILRHFRIPEESAPVVYGCNRILHQASRENPWTEQLKQMTTVEVFVRSGCPHCQAAKKWIPTLQQQYPGLRIQFRDLLEDTTNQKRLTDLVARHRTAAASVPVFHLCNQLVVGFDCAETTGSRIKNLLEKWTHPCPKTAYLIPNAEFPPQDSHRGELQNTVSRTLPLFRSLLNRGLLPDGVVGLRLSVSLLSGLNDSGLIQTDVSDNSTDPISSADENIQESSQPEDFPPGDLPLPTELSDMALDSAGSSDGAAASDEIDLPLFGRLSARGLGLPLFTIAVGLVDGFNPCAMWILLFLLSILVNLKDRLRILMIAGTFVLISGIAYFAFMAAWLNVFLLIGYLRPIQLGLGLMAVCVGAVHIKDFFAFRQGFSLSIPESAKPGLYARVRRIVTAEHLYGAIAGAIVLAVLVNVIELLCTAGLPALYTNILTQQGLSRAGQYGYLALYILAYMFDDSLMIAVVVVTLSRTKLQESHGRWLKLISGLVIAVLGLVMVFRPEWLNG